MPNSLIPELDTLFLFQRQPVSIPADMRPGWRICIIILLLRMCCRQNRSTFGRVHVLSWAVRTSGTRCDLISVLNGEDSLDSLLVRIEPSVNRAVDLASGASILKLSGDRIEITGNSIELADRLIEADSIFSDEKEFFSTIGKRVTEDFVKRLFSTAGRR